MPYTHSKVGNKECVFKKEDGSRVGCTSGSIEKYLKALYANANESVNKGVSDKKPKIFTYTSYRLPNQEDLNEINSANLTAKEILNGFTYTIVGRGVLSDKTKIDITESIKMLINIDPNNEEYKKALTMANELEPRFKAITEMKGGKADNLTVTDIADKFGVPVSQINKQINLGKKVEKEHTDSTTIAKEIAMDHLSEFPDYYTRLAKLEKEASEHLKAIQMNETTKNLIKRLIRENLNYNKLTPEYFKTRIPFLKDFNFFKNERDNTRVEAQRVVYHKNVIKKFNDELFKFPQFNISSEFTYYQQKINDRITHNFIFKNKFHPMQPSNMDDLTFRVFLMALKQNEEKLSFSYESENVNLDEIINKINAKMFEIEKVSDENNTPLF